MCVKMSIQFIEALTLPLPSPASHSPTTDIQLPLLSLQNLMPLPLPLPRLTISLLSIPPFPFTLKFISPCSHDKKKFRMRFFRVSDNIMLYEY